MGKKQVAVRVVLLSWVLAFIAWCAWFGLTRNTWRAGFVFACGGYAFNAFIMGMVKAHRAAKKAGS